MAEMAAILIIGVFVDGWLAQNTHRRAARSVPKPAKASDKIDETAFIRCSWKVERGHGQASNLKLDNTAFLIRLCPAFT
jgi:hypothetical protein